jgi:hypothetical protein
MAHLAAEEKTRIGCEGRLDVYYAPNRRQQTSGGMEILVNSLYRKLFIVLRNLHKAPKERSLYKSPCALGLPALCP